MKFAKLKRSRNLVDLQYSITQVPLHGHYPNVKGHQSWTLRLGPAHTGPVRNLTGQVHKGARKEFDWASQCAHVGLVRYLMVMSISGTSYASMHPVKNHPTRVFVSVKECLGGSWLY